jgi:hypothetical protein
LKEAKEYLKDIFDVIRKYVDEVNAFFKMRGSNIKFKPVTLEFITNTVVPKLGRSKLYETEQGNKPRSATKNKDPSSKNRSPFNSTDEDEDDASSSSLANGLRTEMRKTIEDHFNEAGMYSSPLATSYLGYTPSDVSQVMNRMFNNAGRMFLSCPVPLKHLEEMPLGLKNIEYTMPSIAEATARRQLVVNTRTDPRFPRDLEDQFRYAFLAPYPIYRESAKSVWPDYADEIEDDFDYGDEYDSEEAVKKSKMGKRSPILSGTEFRRMFAEISYESTNRDLRNFLITQEAFLSAIEDIKPSLDLETYYKLVLYYNSSKKMK